MALSCFRFVLLVYTPNLIESNYIDAITVCSPSSLCIGRVDRLQRLHVLFPFLHDCLLMTDPLQGHYTIPYRSSLSMQSPPLHHLRESNTSVRSYPYGIRPSHPTRRMRWPFFFPRRADQEGEPARRVRVISYGDIVFKTTQCYKTIRFTCDNAVLTVF